MSTTALELDVPAFVSWIAGNKAFYSNQGCSVSVLVLPVEMEALIDAAFWKGMLVNSMRYGLDRKGKICAFIDGIRLRFTNRVALHNSLWVVNGRENQRPLDGPITPTSSTPKAS